MDESPVFKKGFIDEYKAQFSLELKTLSDYRESKMMMSEMTKILKVCVTAIGSNYAKDTIKLMITDTTNIDGLVALNDQDKVVGFIITQLGECKELPSTHSVRLICVTGGFKSAFLLGAYIYCLKKSGADKGILELANNYFNISGVITYMRCGFVRDNTLLSPNCLWDMYSINLPMSIKLTNFSLEDIIKNIKNITGTVSRLEMTWTNPNVKADTSGFYSLKVTNNGSIEFAKKWTYMLKFIKEWKDLVESHHQTNPDEKFYIKVINYFFADIELSYILNTGNDFTRVFVFIKNWLQIIEANEYFKKFNKQFIEYMAPIVYKHIKNKYKLRRPPFTEHFKTLIDELYRDQQLALPLKDALMNCNITRSRKIHSPHTKRPTKKTSLVKKVKKSPKVFF